MIDFYEKKDRIKPSTEGSLTVNKKSKLEGKFNSLT